MLTLGFSSLAFVTLAVVGVSAQTAGGYQQCGGLNFSGPTACVSGWHCEKLNDWYSQCLPGDASVATSTTLSATIVTSVSSVPTITVTASSTVVSPSATGAGPGATLLPNYYWIRAVTTPNYHKYLQSSTPLTASDAVLNDASTAGQFNIVNGQLVQLINTTGTLLYAHVTVRPDSTVNQLLVTWATTPDTYGTSTDPSLTIFSKSLADKEGDTVTWTTPGITRPNTAAFLVCESQRVYINLGAYLYLTPAGCYDHTIHYYNGATADV